MDNVNKKSVNSVMTAPPPSALPTDGTGMSTCSVSNRPISNVHTGVVQLDPWLSPFKDALRHRFSKAQKWLTDIKKSEGGIEKFSRVSGLFDLFRAS